MNLDLCTLFEGDYHLGVGVLVNSLHAAGYRGVVWAGYRGPLPEWAQPVTQGDGFAEFAVAEGLSIRFLPLETPAHLTNYKPDFMLRLLAGEAARSEGLVYLDPDIVVQGKWSFFEDWLTCGVALCEDVNSPFPLQHPRRVGWRRFFPGLRLEPREACYANGGFVGVRREYIEFLERWRVMQEQLWRELGGSNFVGIGGGQAIGARAGFADCFDKTDQDVLNAAIEASPEIPVSFLNRQAMAFEPGGACLPHALGPKKPWNKCYLSDALSGRPPRTVDKAFWRFAGAGPIAVFPAATLNSRQNTLPFASAIGRFIRRT
ncbi:MAG: hypothetical protein ACFUZC_09830 [Chthoniobacteraceae bacterium]